MSYNPDLSHINRDSDLSLGGQLADVVRGAIESGALEPGAKLPTTRQLAADAGVNHLTVVRAYRKLAAEGFVTAARGRGTFVRQAPPKLAIADGRWQHIVLPPGNRSYSDQMAAGTWVPDAREDHINLATGWPSADLHPVRELGQITAQVFAEVGAPALMYGETDGLWSLREGLAERGATAGFASDPDEIMVTAGGRQGIDLICRTILRPGDVAVSESPTFMGTLASMRNSGARVIGVPYDEQGLDVVALERVLTRHEVKLVSVQTGSQNPTGQDMSPERAERLVALAQERSFFILEDGVYSTVRFGTREPNRLRQRAPDQVIYVDSISKTVGGGLRVGWIAASGEIRRRLTELKLATDHHTSLLPQHIVQRWLSRGAHDRHLGRVNAVQTRRASAIVDSIERRLADDVTVVPPRGGHNVWLTFRRPVDERLLMAEALRQGVSFTPGAATTVEGDDLMGLRLSFSLLDEELLDEGVRRLAAAIREVRRSSNLRRPTAMS